MINVIALARQVKLENEKISDSGSQADIKCDFTAIEAAVRLKETTDCKVSAIIMGYEKTALSQARDAIAMVVFARAICVRELDKLDAWGCARAFIQAVGDEKYDLIISGGFPGRRRHGIDRSFDGCYGRAAVCDRRRQNICF